MSSPSPRAAGWSSSCTRCWCTCRDSSSSRIRPSAACGGTSSIDSSLTLNWWNGEEITLRIKDSEVCATTPTSAMKPYQSEYTGYMGNWGGTRDRWYRRAAIVLWPKERSFAAQAEASASWALRELRRLTDAGDLAAAQAAASSAEPFWDASVSEPAFEPTLNVALSLDAPQTATMLLQPFRVEMLGPEHAPALLALAAHYGPEWTASMITAWFGRSSRFALTQGELQRPDWLAALPALCLALGSSDGVADELLAKSWGWVSDQIRMWLEHPAVSTRDTYLHGLAKPLTGLLRATAVSGRADLRDSILAFLRDRADETLILTLAALRAAQPRARMAARRGAPQAHPEHHRQRGTASQAPCSARGQSPHPDPDQDRRALRDRTEGTPARHHRPRLARRELASRGRSGMTDATTAPTPDVELPDTDGKETGPRVPRVRPLATEPTQRDLALCRPKR
jgi:hypothetical protein